MKLQNKIEGMKARLDVDGVLLTDERKQILSYAIKELLSKLKNGDLDPISVLEAYQVISCTTYCMYLQMMGEIFFNGALIFIILI